MSRMKNGVGVQDEVQLNNLTARLNRLRKEPRLIVPTGGPAYCAWIWISSAVALVLVCANMFAEGMPVLRKDFSQSAVDGPRMLPSM
jgi:hypothetical protein